MDFKMGHGIKFQREDDRGLVEIKYETSKISLRPTGSTPSRCEKENPTRQTALRGHSYVMKPEENWVSARG